MLWLQSHRSVWPRQAAREWRAQRPNCPVLRLEQRSKPVVFYYRGDNCPCVGTLRGDIAERAPNARQGAAAHDERLELAPQESRRPRETWWRNASPSGGAFAAARRQCPLRQPAVLAE